MASKVFFSLESLGRGVLVQVTLTAVTNRFHAHKGSHLSEVYLVLNITILEMGKHVVRVAVPHVVTDGHS